MPDNAGDKDPALAKAPNPRSPLLAGTVRVDVVDLAGRSLRGAMMIVGFPTHGLVGSVAIKYLVETLEMTPVARVESPSLPPTVVMDEGLVDSPIRVYASRMACGPDKKCGQLVVAISEIAIDAPLIGAVGEARLDWAEAKGVKMIFAIEGKPREGGSANEEIPVLALGNAPGLPGIRSYGFPRASGMLTGFGAAVLKAGLGRKIPIVCLLPEAEKDRPDGRAAAKVVETIRPLVPQLGLDPGPLRQKSEELETEQREHLHAQRDAVTQLANAVPFGIYG